MYVRKSSSSILTGIQIQDVGLNPQTSLSVYVKRLIWTCTRYLDTVATSLDDLIKNLMLFPTFAPRLDFHTVQQSSFQVFVSYTHADKGSMRRIKFIRFDSPPNLEYLGRRQWDHIWD